MNRYEADGLKKLVEAGLESYGALLGVGVAMQEQNARIALGVLSAQAGAVVTLLEQAGAQQEAWMSLAGDAFRVRPKTEQTADTGTAGLPLGDYDRLDAGELERRLGGLSVGEVQRLKAHERRTRNRRSMMECMDRALV